MRTFIFAFLLLVAAASTRAQTQTTARAQTATHQRGDTIVIETMPTFQGQEYINFRRWVAQRVKYPEYALKRTIQGTVVVAFVVETDGELSKIDIVKSPHSSLSEEVLRVVKHSPLWEPGAQEARLKDGTVVLEKRAVSVQVLIPVTFRLNNYARETEDPQYVGPSKGASVSEILNTVDTSPAHKFVPKGFEGKVYGQSEVKLPPRFGDGNDTERFMQYIRENVKVPKKVARNTMSMPMGLMFIVEPDGSVSSAKVLNSPDKALAGEIERVAGKSPEWEPGAIGGGITVRTQMVMPLIFSALE